MYCQYSFINNPSSTLLSPIHGPNPSRTPLHEGHNKRPREQYLGSLKEPFNKNQEDLRIFHFTLEQCRKSRSWRELYVSAELLEMVGSLLSGCIVPLYLDSQVAVMNLAGDIPQYPGNVFGGSKKEEIQDLVNQIFNLTEQHNFGIHPIWIPREQNERADFNSHLNEYNHYDFRLKSEVFFSSAGYTIWTTYYRSLCI